jgi:redox-sensing transcriptional repressor
MLPEPTVERLSRYRRILRDLHSEGRNSVFSHDLAEMAHSNPAQVRRDVMLIGHSGSPATGYSVVELRKAIGKVLDDPALSRSVVIGLGNLGQAVMGYFGDHHSRFTVAAAFDIDPEKVGTENCGVPTYSMDDLEEVILDSGIRIAILAIPKAVAQEVANRLYGAGITGIVNFAQIPLKAPSGVFVELVDIAATWEKVAYFSRQR